MLVLEIISKCTLVKRLKKEVSTNGELGFSVSERICSPNDLPNLVNFG